MRCGYILRDDKKNESDWIFCCFCLLKEQVVSGDKIVNDTLRIDVRRGVGSCSDTSG